MGFFILYTSLIMAMAFSVIVYLTSQYGIGISPDPAIYLAGARNLLAGNGFTYMGEPITYFPPLYSILLAGVGLLTQNIDEGARFLNAFLFALNAGLISITVYSTSNRNLWTTIAASMMFVVCSGFLSLHSQALSEPLFFTLFMLGIFLAVRYWENVSLYALGSASFLFGLASVTRYAGIAFLPVPLCLAVLRNHRSGLKSLMRHSLVGLMPHAFLIGSVLLYNHVVAGSATGQSIAYHLPTCTHMRQAIVALHDYIFPIMRLNMSKASLAWLGLSAPLGTIFVLLSQKKKGYERSSDKSMLIPYLLSAMFYILFLFNSFTFFDAHFPFDFRILSPAFILITLGVFSCGWAIFRKEAHKATCFRLMMVFFTVAVIVKGAYAIALGQRIYLSGQGFTSREWRESAGIRYVQDLPQSVVVYSNGWDAISTLSGHEALPVPRHTIPESRLPNPEYETSLTRMCKEIEEGSAIFVYFEKVDWRWYLPSREILEDRCRLRVIEHLNDAVVYGNY